MANEFLEKLRSINFGNPAKRGPKRETVDTEAAVVTTTDHWNDRRDVTVKPRTIETKGPIGGGA